jgi:hypothetical protein
MMIENVRVFMQETPGLYGDGSRNRSLNSSVLAWHAVSMMPGFAEAGVPLVIESASRSHAHRC